MILTTLPDLPPRPENPANAAFRRRFYARWGRENAVVCGRATQVEYAVIPHTLSIKMTQGGRERFFLPHREVVVDDDNLLVLDEGTRYGSLLQGDRPAWTFAIFFRPGMQHEVAAQQSRGIKAALDCPDRPAQPVAFAGHLRRHQGGVSRRLKHIASAVVAGERDENWLEEQLTVLLDAMLTQERAAAVVASPRPALRAELHRRLRRAVDLIESDYDQALCLERLAAEASLSRFHFVREFTRLFGISPHAYLTRKRAHAARRALAAGIVDRDTVAQRCGFGSRWSLQRALARHGSADPD
ncbi:MAG: helix-turn-helix domain-containing protein [Aquabacterium sp.]